MNVVTNHVYEPAVVQTMDEPPVARVAPEGAPGEGSLAVDKLKVPELPEFDWKTVGTAMMSRRAYRRCAGPTWLRAVLALDTQARGRSGAYLKLHRQHIIYHEVLPFTISSQSQFVLRTVSWQHHLTLRPSLWHLNHSYRS